MGTSPREAKKGRGTQRMRWMKRPDVSNAQAEYGEAVTWDKGCLCAHMSVHVNWDQGVHLKSKRRMREYCARDMPV